MRFLSVVASVLVVIVSFNLMNAPADEPIVIPDEQVVVPPVVPDGCNDRACPIVVVIPDTPTYSASVGRDDCRKPLRKAVGKVGRAVVKIAKVRGKIAKGIGKVVRVPFRAVRGAVRARPIRRVLGRVFGRRG